MTSSTPSTPKKGAINNLSSFPTYSAVSRARLKSLYSDFSAQKLSNPAGFQSNVDWWKRTLLDLLSCARQPNSPDALILHSDAAFQDGLRCPELGVGKPLGLASVLTELSASSVVIPLNAFKVSSTSIYYSGSLPGRVASYLLGRPLWWALEQLNIVSETYREPEEQRWKRVQGDYVAVPLLEQAADAVVEYYATQPHTTLADSLYDLDSFRQKFASQALPDVTLSVSDIKVLIKYLERDRRVIVTSNEVIKFLGDAQENATVTQVDHGILELKLAVNRLQSQIEDIQHQIEDRTAKVMEQLKRKRKEMAMSLLRSRKLLEDLLQKRFQSLETLQATLFQVESAAGNVEIMKLYETSTATLKSILSHPSLQRDKVDATMAALEAAAADHAEIDEAIRLGGEGITQATGTIIDDSEIEREIQRMIEEKEQEEAEKREQEELERLHGQRRETEREAQEEREQQQMAEKRQQEQERQKDLVKNGRSTLVSEDSGDLKIWEERWLNAQADKAAEAIRSREEEVRQRARWEDEGLKRTQAA